MQGCLMKMMILLVEVVAMAPVKGEELVLMVVLWVMILKRKVKSWLEPFLDFLHRLSKLYKMLILKK